MTEHEHQLHSVSDEAKNTLPTPLQEISHEMVRIYKDQFGRGPTKVRTNYAGRDALVCLLEQTFTPAERNLQAMGEHQPATGDPAVLSVRRAVAIRRADRTDHWSQGPRFHQRSRCEPPISRPSCSSSNPKNLSRRTDAPAQPAPEPADTLNRLPALSYPREYRAEPAPGHVAPRARPCRALLRERGSIS